MVLKNRSVVILGIWIAIIPFTGFPNGFKSFLIILSGFAVAIISYFLARNKRMSFSHETFQKETVTEIFVENGPIIKSKEIEQEERFTDLEAIRKNRGTL
jgi:hypothetical protein